MREIPDDESWVPRQNGGARQGAGRKPLGYQKPEETINFDKARARKEVALADLSELDYKVKSAQYVSRIAVRQASATAMSTLAQTLRSLPDNLERKGVAPSVCAVIDQVIMETLADTAKALSALHAGAVPDDNMDLF